MRGCTQRQGWRFKDLFLLVVVGSDHKNVRDELAVSPWCPRANSQQALLSHGGCFLNSNRGMSGRIQTRCAIKHAEGLMNTIGPPHWWIFSAATETRDGYLFKRAPTKGLCGGLTSALQQWRPSNTSMSAFLSCVKSFISKERHPDLVMEIIRFPLHA